jgi:hypothetical protein
VYVFVYKNGTFKQVTDNLSVADILAVTEGVLSIVRFHGKFQYLVNTGEALVWRPVPEATLLIAGDARLHH